MLKGIVLIMKNQTVSYSIILAAGKGTRFKSRLPKVLHKISGRSLLEVSIRAVLPHTKEEVIIVAGFGYSEVCEEVELLKKKLKVNIPLTLVKQEEQNGTGHATKVASDYLGEKKGDVLIIPGDCPLLNSDCMANLIADRSSDFSLLSVNLENPFGFGRIIRSDKCEFQAIVEEKDCTEEQRLVKEVNTGIVRTTQESLKTYLPLLETNNKQGEYYLTDLPALMLKDQKDVRAIVTSDQNSVKGANTRYELYLLEEYARKERLKALMESGVTVESIDSVFIDADSEVESDVYLGANTRIKGTSIVKSGAVLEGGSLIKDSIIHENVLLRLGSYVDQSEIEKEVTVGPFAQIRPHSHLGEGVRIGNFVETKACKMGKGSKANHLAYLGDVSIGANSNIGAGTIVCNYDGKNKNKTIIGDQVFVGSNSTLVAPVELESNTYVAAGSVVTKKVPSGSLALGRSRQVNKDGWVTNKKS